MKKTLKYIAALSGCILAQHISNLTYLNLMKLKTKPRIKRRSTEYFYQWRFGRIRYKIIGKGEPLLLIHGIYPGAGMYQWNRIDRDIFKTHTVYAIDLLGFGRSEKPNLSYSAYLYIQMINDFIRDVIRKPVIAAASDYSAAYAVMGCVFDPDLYQKLLLINPSGLTKGYEMPLLKDYAFKMLLESPVLGTAAYLFLLNRFTGGPLLQNLWQKRSIASNIPPDISPTAYIGGSNAKFPISALFSQYLNVNIKDKLNRIAIPTLILSDEYNGLINVSSCPNIMDFLNVKRNLR